MSERETPETDRSVVCVPRETLQRWRLAFPVLRDVLNAAPLHGGGVAASMLEEIDTAINERPPNYYDEEGGACNVCGGGIRYGERHSSCGAAVMRLERERDEAMEALRETATKLSEICADFNMTRMIMNDAKTRDLAGQIVMEGRAIVDRARALLAKQQQSQPKE